MYLEIQAVRFITETSEDGTVRSSFEMCEEEVADYFGVYTRDEEGLAVHIEDFDTRKDAEFFIRNFNQK